MRTASRATLAFVALLILAASSAGAQLRDLTIGSRALTDGDMEKLVAITREVAIARQGIPSISSAEGAKQVRAAVVTAAEKQGWGSLDFSVVDSRIKAALMHIRMEATTPVPPEKKADVELARLWKERLEEAKAGKGP
jgi:hypothetical protein